jgi:hypothetical protein
MTVVWWQFAENRKTPAGSRLYGAISNLLHLMFSVWMTVSTESGSGLF